MTTAAAVDVDAELALTPEGFDRVLHQVLEDSIQIYPTRSWYPSIVGHPCDRFLVFGFTRWEHKRRHSAVLQSIFDEGKLHQGQGNADPKSPTIYNRLQQLGFEIVRESDRPIQYRIGNAVISGRPDGRLIAFRGQRYRPSITLEGKSLAGYVWEQMRTAEDLRKAPSPFTRAYYSQGHLGAFLENVPRGVFVIKNKQTGMLRILPFELDYDHVDWLLRRVERLQPLVDQRVDPEPIPYDKHTCGGCAFRDFCFPAKSFGEGTSVITDELLIEDLAHLVEIKPAADEYRTLRDSCTDRLKLLGIRQAVAGDVVVEGSARKDGVIVYEIRKVSAA